MRELSPSTQLAYSKFALHQDATQTFAGRRLVEITWSQFSQLTMILQEVFYVHRYSGSISLSSAALISSSYAIFTVVTYWFSTYVAPEEYSQPQCRTGIALFVFGEGVNLYHHFILSNLRTTGPNQYKLPQGGLFRYIWCPHYLGEIISFMGIALISQHLYVALLQVSSSLYLCTRAYNTKKWYKEKFGSHHERWCVFPWIF
ncbi:hypothetical protein INT43_003036 [Umbelopsis isabellina]|uniref:3-oxo-5-alpha-steroid 4-dehydrogenase C-terminal domain-containing protein n=1 Tax=Mortierella isabellina TaxID=91625 RepID=A0A8H7UFW6_MORIS|nr:hypothetical protein INT43_003036 [Umbelopsis isabellina]